MNKSDLCSRLEELALVLERPPSERVVFHSFDGSIPQWVHDPSEDFAAEHYRVFCHELMPAASLFLEPRSMLGGDVSARSWEEMKVSAFEPDTSSITADHLVNQLRFVAFLIREGRDGQANRFVQLYMLSWLPVFLNSLSTVGSKDVAPLSMLIEEAILNVVSQSVDMTEALPLIPTRFSLDNSSTGLVSLGIFLSTHAESGLSIPKSALTEEARKLRLPTGFGSKSQTIEGLFRSAAGYDGIGGVCDFLARQVQSHLQVWDEWASRPSLAGISHWAEAWTKKLDYTSRVIETLRQSA